MILWTYHAGSRQTVIFGAMECYLFQVSIYIHFVIQYNICKHVIT